VDHRILGALATVAAAPVPSAQGSPGGGLGATMVCELPHAAYDMDRQRLLLHWGSQGPGRPLFSDTWELDGDAWIRR
jgi:hypothetical protein